MKKLFSMVVALMATATLSAQTLQESKSSDNIYIGLNGGLASATTGHAWLKDLNPNVGLRIGRLFTPVFGLAVESNAYIKNTNGHSTGTIVNGLNTSLLGTVNLTNWIGGYKGEPRLFELTAVYGLGWGHVFGTPTKEWKQDMLTSKAGLDFGFNLGKKKAWQFYLEPAVVFALNGNGYQGVQYNVHRSHVQLNAGIVYKFGNSNGTHNFAIATLRDQAEIDMLNAQINDLRSDLNNKDNEIDSKDKQIADLQQQLNNCENKQQQQANNLQPIVVFRQGKSKIDAAQYAQIELIANYMQANENVNVEIKGYASPEGSTKVNEKLSLARAEAVKNALVKKYNIDANRLTTKGMGATNKLSRQVEFNRVATFKAE